MNRILIYSTLNLLMILWLSSGIALGQVSAPRLKPLSGDRTIDIGDGSPASVRAGLVKRIRQENPWFDADEPGADDLLNYLRFWVRASPDNGKPTLDLKYMGIAFDNYANYRQYAAAVNQLGLPKPFAEAVNAGLSCEIIYYRMPLLMTPLHRTLQQVANGGKMYLNLDGTGLRRALEQTDPGFASLNPMQQKAVYDLLASYNPGMIQRGYYRSDKPIVTDAFATVGVPATDGGRLMYQYRLDPNVPVMIPPVSMIRSVAEAAAGTPAPVEYATYQAPPRTMLVFELPNGLPTAVTKVPVRFYLSHDGGRITSFSAVAPSINNYINRILLTDVAGAREQAEQSYEAYEKGLQRHGLVTITRQFDDHPPFPQQLQIHGDRISGTFRFEIQGADNMYDSYQCTLDLKVTGAQVAGAFKTQGFEVKTSKKGPASYRAMGEPLAGQVVGTVVPVDKTSADPFGGASWPQLRGPNGDGTANSMSETINTKPWTAKLLWVSSDCTGRAEGRDQRRFTDPGDPIAGGYASPMVVGDKVYLFYYRPGGGVLRSDRGKHIAETKVKHRYQVLADDVVVCFDVNTGRLLWKTVFPAKGVNFGAFHKAGFQGSPAVKDGKVYAMGTTGRVYCLDARTGRVIWESSIGRRHVALTRSIEPLLRTGTHIDFNRDFNSSPMPAGDMLILNDQLKYKQLGDYHYEAGDGLLGIDPANGRIRWHVPDCVDGRGNVPAIWQYDGQYYVITADKTGIRCLEAKTGKQRWHDPRGCNELYHIAAVGDYAMTGSQKDVPGRPALVWKITPDSVKLVKQLPVELGASRMGYLIYKGHGYYTSGTARKIVCVELATGKVVATAPHESGLNGEHDNGVMQEMGGIIFTTNGREHEAYRMFNADPNRFVQLGLFSQYFAFAYCSGIELALVDGRIIARLNDRLAAFDFRKQMAQLRKDRRQHKKEPKPIRQKQEKERADDEVTKPVKSPKLGEKKNDLPVDLDDLLD